MIGIDIAEGRPTTDEPDGDEDDGSTLSAGVEPLTDESAAAGTNALYVAAIVATVPTTKSQNVQLLDQCGLTSSA